MYCIGFYFQIICILIDEELKKNVTSSKLFKFIMQDLSKNKTTSSQETTNPWLLLQLSIFQEDTVDSN